MFWALGLCPALLAPDVRRTNPIGKTPLFHAVLGALLGKPQSASEIGVGSGQTRRIQPSRASQPLLFYSARLYISSST
jgi:hypothetical protein